MAVGDLNSTGFNSQISVLSDDLFIDKADKKGSSEVLLAEADVVKTLMAEKKPDIAEATAMTPADTPKDLDPGVRKARSEEVKTVETVRALDRAVASESPENVEKARAAVLEQVPEETLSEAGRTLLDSAQALSEAPAATVVESTVAAPSLSKYFLIANQEGTETENGQTISARKEKSNPRENPFPGNYS